MRSYEPPVHATLWVEGRMDALYHCVYKSLLSPLVSTSIKVDG